MTITGSYLVLTLFHLLNNIIQSSCTQGPVSQPHISAEEQLYNYLLRGYNPAVRPALHPSQPVHVNISFSLMQIHALDEKTQVFTTNGWLIVQWVDRRLTWKKERFSNMTQFIVESYRLWTPEIALINSIREQFPNFNKYRITIENNGILRWEPAGIFETTCKINIAFYPYDSQTCEVVFGTWSYTSFKVNLTNSMDRAMLDDYRTSGEWKIMDAVVERREFIYNCCEEIRFSKVAVIFQLQRRHGFFTLNLVMPCMMLSLLTLVTFLSPPDQGEKISLGISVLLSFSVFMLTLADNMPKTSIYTTVIMFMNTLSVMLTVLVLNLHHRKPNRPIPPWLASIVFDCMGRLLCMHHRRSNKSLETAAKRRQYKNEVAAFKRRQQRHTHMTCGHVTARHPRTILQDGLDAYEQQQTLTSATNTTTTLQTRINPNGGNFDLHNVTTDGASDSEAIDEQAQLDLRLLKINGQEPGDWKKVAAIVDRFLFLIVCLCLIAITASIFGILWSPHRQNGLGE